MNLAGLPVRLSSSFLRKQESIGMSLVGLSAPLASVRRM